MKLIELKEILEKIVESGKEDGATLYFPTIVDVPKGKKQNSDISIFDHEYVNQEEDFCGNIFGDMYYPLEDGKYLKVIYFM
jgi:hypothetical protein